MEKWSGNDDQSQLCNVRRVGHTHVEESMEVCVDSVASSINAETGGASRLELCSNLVEGGTTPSCGLLKTIKLKVRIPVFVMIRPRGGDFLYSEDEFSVMQEDVRLLKEHGADGFVFGILSPSGGVDVDRCRTLLDLCRPLPVTFHRAFDMAKDPVGSLEDLVELRFDRVLTSGHRNTAFEGLDLIAQLVARASGRIVVVPGAGINEGNLESILRKTGVQEFHCSARNPISSVMQYRNGLVSMGCTYQPDEFTLKVADSVRVAKLCSIANAVWSAKLEQIDS